MDENKKEISQSIDNENLPEGAEQENPEKKKDGSAGKGMILGMMLGSVFGMMYHMSLTHMVIGMVIGMLIGVSAGSLLDVAKKQKK